MTLAADFERLVAEHRKRVFRVCRSILRDDHLGADAAQETFLRLWRHLRTGSLPERPEAWLRTAAATSALDLVRRRRLRRAHEEPRASLADLTDPVADVTRDVLADDLHDHLARALERLPEGQRTVFVLRHEGGLALREVAATLGLSLPTVKTQFARACVRLQTLLRAFRPGPETGP